MEDPYTQHDFSENKHAYNSRTIATDVVQRTTYRMAYCIYEGMKWFSTFSSVCFSQFSAQNASYVCWLHFSVGCLFEFSCFRYVRVFSSFVIAAPNGNKHCAPNCSTHFFFLLQLVARIEYVCIIAFIVHTCIVQFTVKFRIQFVTMHMDIYFHSDPN